MTVYFNNVIPADSDAEKTCKTKAASISFQDHLNDTNCVNGQKVTVVQKPCYDLSPEFKA